jgi:hypothetical protein
MMLVAMPRMYDVLPKRRSYVADARTDGPTQQCGFLAISWQNLHVYRGRHVEAKVRT